MSVRNERCILSPSLICLDMGNLESRVRTLEACGVSILHLDIPDGRIRPKNIGDWGRGAGDAFVAGSTCVDRDDLPGSFARLKDPRSSVLR